ncbi:hypothetical protein [Wolbachia endosymbiont (group A) of Lasioglossum fulvicorne]|uniref:hypothetical protein n=1 Tax=Wolbachia endosymbiont (group A) of Lasioglossum fulvicorne TaxID=3066201 RepID=UPI0033423F86
MNRLLQQFYVFIFTTPLLFNCSHEGRYFFTISQELKKSINKFSVTLKLGISLKNILFKKTLFLSI